MAVWCLQQKPVALSLFNILMVMALPFKRLASLFIRHNNTDHSFYDKRNPVRFFQQSKIGVFANTRINQKALFNVRPEAFVYYSTSS